MSLAADFRDWWRRAYLVEKLIVGMMGASVAIAVGGLFFQPYMEARTYNKLTGANVTMWDAMWSDLRVTAPPAKKSEAP